MVGWHHQFNGHECAQAPGVDNGQGSLVCCSPWGHKESGTTENTPTHITWIYHSLFMHSSTQGYLDCFQVLSILSKAAINICVQVFVWR